MGEHDQDAVAEPAQPPLDATRARAITTGLREAMDDIRHTVAVLAARVRDAHTARVWTPLGYPSWEAYCDAEFGISHAQAKGCSTSPAPGRHPHWHRTVSHPRHRPGRRGGGAKRWRCA